MKRPEQQIQRAVFLHLKRRAAPGVFAFHPANGGYRKPIEAAILTSLGLRSGVPDVIAIHKGKVFGLELKAEGSGRLSANQMNVQEEMLTAGAIVDVAYGLDDALQTLERWGLLRGQAA